MYNLLPIFKINGYLNLWVCVCTCVYARLRTCLCGNGCLFLLLFYFLFLQHALSLNLELPDSRYTDLPVSPIDPSESSFPAIGKMQTTRPDFFNMCFGIKPMSSCLCSQHCYHWTSSPPLYVIPNQSSCTKPMETHSPFILPNLAPRSPWSRRQQVETKESYPSS